MTAKELKNALLQEAVQGKLVPQIASEGNARDLLEEIRKEKFSHGFANSYGICDGKNKKTKSSDLRSKSQISVTKKELSEITEDEIPFEIPESWCWCRWGDLSESIQYGYNAPAKETGRIKMVRISDIHENKVFWDSVPYCDISEDEIQTYILKKNDILFARTGGTVGKSFLVQDVPCEAIYAGYLIRTHYNSEKLVPQYLKFFMESNLYWEQLKEGTIATAQPNCNGKTLSKMLIPLPPLAEQKRIVAAIEKFMPLIEEYGKRETELKALNEQIGTLTKKAILQEAVQGKLVPQIAAEGNAKDLLEEIKKEKTKLIKEGKIKKEKPLPEISEDEIPFDIPESWCWCRLGEIVHNNGQKTPDKEFSYIDIGSIDNEHQKLNEKENFIQPENAPSRARKIVKKGDIIYSTVRPYLHNMCIIDKDFEKEPIASTGFAVLTCYPQINNQYLFYYLLSPSFDNYANDTENSKGVAYPAINDDRLYKGIVPLPPLEEQKRIVTAIEKILPLCEKLGT